MVQKLVRGDLTVYSKFSRIAMLESFITNAPIPEHTRKKSLKSRILHKLFNLTF